MSELLEGVGKVLASPIVIELVAAVVAVIWALPRLQRWRSALRSERWGRLLTLAERCVVLIHHNYVEELKRGREDGKLTVEEAREARQRALTRLITELRENAPEFLDHYVTPELLTAIEKAHAWLQSSGAL